MWMRAAEPAEKSKGGKQRDTKTLSLFGGGKCRHTTRRASAK